MHVVATAGHVDHGKSTLVRALTGMEPDRWAEERRRGMTIDLGFAWTTITDALGAETIAFIDVPGHERFVPNMLAGVGPAPAALVVVAADEGWMPQTAEHVAALNALGVTRAVVAISRCDLADPARAAAQTQERLAKTTLHDAETVAVGVEPEGETHGLDALRAALLRLVRSLPQPDLDAPVRLWVDRSFTVRGAGTVVTGTLPAGILTAETTLALASSNREIHARGLQSLGEPVEVATAVARVAVNVRGVEKSDVRRGDALVTPGAWLMTRAIDVRVTSPDAETPARPLSSELMLHVGSAAVPARMRPLAGDAARLTFATALPLRADDVLLLRDPGRHRIVSGARILDPDPPEFRRRGAALARGRELTVASGRLDASTELRRSGIARAADLRARGISGLPAPFTGDWLVDEARALQLRDRLRRCVEQYAARFPLEAGPSVEAVCRVLELPDRALLSALIATMRDSSLEVRDGRVIDTARTPLPPAVARAVTAISSRLSENPFAAPEARELAALGLGPRELAAAERAGALLRIADGIVLLPDAVDVAAARLAKLPAPFSVSDARVALGTSRRVAVPLLEYLDRRGVTRRDVDGFREMVSALKS